MEYEYVPLLGVRRESRYFVEMRDEHLQITAVDHTGTDVQSGMILNDSAYSVLFLSRVHRSQSQSSHCLFIQRSTL